jgi:hypothetical protein
MGILAQQARKYIQREEPATETPPASSTEPTEEQWHEWKNQRNDPDFKFHRVSLNEKSDVDMSLDHVINNEELEEKKQQMSTVNQTS